MPANMETIQLPVSLQVNASELQSIINDLQASMEKVKPDSKAYAKLSSELVKIQGQMDAITADMRQGFQNPTQLNKFEQKIRNLGTGLQTMATQLSRVTFEDLNIDLIPKEELDKLQQLQQALAAAQARVDGFQTTQMHEVVKESEQLRAAFSELKLDVDTSSFDKTIKEAEKKIQTLRENAAKSQTKLATKQQAVRDAQALAQTGSELEGIFSGNAAKRTDSRFFKANGDYAAGGRDLFIKQLEQIGIDAQTLEALGNESARNIAQFWDKIEKELQKGNLLFKTREAVRKAETELQEVKVEDTANQTAVANVEQLLGLLHELQNIDVDGTRFHEVFMQLQDGLRQAAVEAENYKQQIKETAIPSSGTEQSVAELTQRIRELEAEVAQLKSGMYSAAAANREMEASQQRLSAAIRQWFSFREVINLTKRAISDAVNHIKELDATMTQIAVVTDMSQSDLWGQISTYSAIAQQYGVSTNGVYQVSQLFYQQGLQTADVMDLTTETLKMAKIANLDYATATDYMTVAIRGFKLEMSDAQTVTDVYSHIAAISASDTEELAVAMSKTASSAEAVGASFENTTAMIALRSSILLIRITSALVRHCGGNHP